MDARRSHAIPLCRSGLRAWAETAILRRPFRPLGPLGRLAALALVAVIAAFIPVKQVLAEEPRSLLLATTTSVRDSGLLDALLPTFTEQSGIEVRVIAVGTGAALRMGREGNADLLLTHAPAAEMELVEDGIVRRRTPFMQNFFVIAGPKEDPAGVAEAPSPEAALRSIANMRTAWVSRADDSGTHKREKSLFAAAGLPADLDWAGFERTGSGMGLSLQVAGAKRAYILSDIGTFLAFQKRTELVALSKPSDSLRNVYALLQLEPARFEHALKTSEAEALEQFLLTPATLQRIAAYGRNRFGRALFTPLPQTPSSLGSPSAPRDSPRSAPGPDAEQHMLGDASASAILEITLRTLWVCGSALVLALAIGVPIGIGLGGRRFAGRSLFVTTVNAGMGAPPVVVGLVTASLLWRSGPLGDLGIMYTRSAHDRGPGPDRCPARRGDHPRGRRRPR